MAQPVRYPIDFYVPQNPIFYHLGKVLFTRISSNLVPLMAGLIIVIPELSGTPTNLRKAKAKPERHHAMNTFFL